MHFNALFASLAALTATGASAAVIPARQEPNPTQLTVRTFGNDRCQNQNFNGLSMAYVVLKSDIGKCRTFTEDKNYPVGSIAAEFTEGAENDTCAVTTYTDSECKHMDKNLVSIGKCVTGLIDENVCPRPTGPKSFIYNC